jgi:hypothetical protein
MRPLVIEPRENTEGKQRGEREMPRRISFWIQNLIGMIDNFSQ